MEKSPYLVGYLEWVPCTESGVAYAVCRQHLLWLNNLHLGQQTTFLCEIENPVLHIHKMGPT